ncbi:amino acid permease, partial [Candidatus Fermentibacteria bacterium]|nr:amino acid permease [Candidatus Fermentibacteria bacterium]
YTVRYLAQLGLLDSFGGYSIPAIKLTAVLVALFFLAINYRGAGETGRVGAFFTLGQTGFLIVIGVIGVIVAIRDPSRLRNFEPFMPHGWVRLLLTMGFTYVAFEGFEVIAQAGDEAIEPRRNLPKAMLYSVLIVTLTYVSVAFAAVVAVKQGSPGVSGAPWEWIGSHRERGFGEAIAHLMPGANFLLTLAVIFASTSALNATVYSATRAAYALGRDRMLPGLFAAISSKRKTPWGALLVTGLIVIVVAVALPTMDVASSASIMFLFLFFLVNLCVIRIRMNMGDELSYGFVMPFFPVPPLLAIVCQAALAIWLVHMSLIAWIIAPVWILGGLLVYRRYARHHATASDDEIVVLEETREELAGDHYRIVVPVANPKDALGLEHATYKICQAKNGQIELLHIVPVPKLIPLSNAARYMREGKGAIEEMMLYLDASFSVSTTILYCRSVARAIVSRVRERHADLLILGWHGTRRGRLFRLGSTLDPIIESAPCSVVIMKDCGNKHFNRVLVPVAGGPNSRFALEVAAILVEDGGEIVAFTAMTDGRQLDIDEYVTQFIAGTSPLRVPITTRSVVTRNVLGAILKESARADLVVIGATREPLLRLVTRRSLPDKVARLCDRPLIIVKASGGLRAWIHRWV